ncbi:MAG: family 16 glycosylhydrolase [Alphaproteobacteria bacterium]
MRFLYLLLFTLIAHIAQAAEIDTTGFMDPFTRIEKSRWSPANGWVNGDHQACEWRANSAFVVREKLQLVIAKNRLGKLRPTACPELHTKKLSGYGYYEARMKIAAGSGLNTNLFTYIGPPTGSPEHDEIDFEFLGKDTRKVQINYFTNGKGKHEVMLPLGFDASEEFHDYAFEWTANKIRWFVDGKMAHETPPNAIIPHNPGRIYLSLWAGSKIQDSWLGPFQFTKPITAEVEWVAFTPEGKKCLFPESVSCKQ